MDSKDHSKHHGKDTIFSCEETTEGAFVFDDKVVRVFPDMIARSAPGYELMVPMIGLLARRYARPGSNVFDLGCSLGATTLAIRDAAKAEDIRIIAVDNSASMVNQCRENMQPYDGPVQVDVREEDIRNTVIENASVVAMNLTLQFISPPDRLDLLKRISKGMNRGGIFILSEKVRFEDDRSQQDQASWHRDFKRAKGYSDLEIARKRTALENVLEPDTVEQHTERLMQAGFNRVERWFQCFSFQSFVAFR